MRISGFIVLYQFLVFIAIIDAGNKIAAIGIVHLKSKLISFHC